MRFLLALGLCALLQAQATVHEGKGLAALWAREGGCNVQQGSQLLALQHAAEGWSRTEGPTLPATVTCFDWGTALLRVEGADAILGERRYALGASPVRWTAPRVPLRLALIHGAAAVLPHRDGLLWAAGDATQIIPVPAVDTEIPGYGFGDQARITRSTPWALPLAEDLLVCGVARKAWRVTRGQQPEDLHWTPEETDLLGGFVWECAPLKFGRGAGEAACVLADAASGTLALFTDLRNTGEPRQVLRVDGGVLALATTVRDGAPVLSVLRTRRLSLVEQLDVLKSGRLAVELMHYPLQSDGMLPRSPRGRISGSLPVTVAISNDLRTVTFPCAVLITDQVLLVAEPDGRVLRYGAARAPAQQVGAIAPGHALDDFGGVSCATEWIFGWIGADGVDRVYSLPAR